MGKYEVTQEQYESVMGNNPSCNKGAKLPITDVSWKDCQEFITKLNSKTNGSYRSPIKAEWSIRAGLEQVQFIRLGMRLRRKRQTTSF